MARRTYSEESRRQAVDARREAAEHAAQLRAGPISIVRVASSAAHGALRERNRHWLRADNCCVFGHSRGCTATIRAALSTIH